MLVTAAPDTFAEIIKVTNHTGQWDAELECYSPNLPLWFGAQPQNQWF